MSRGKQVRVARLIIRDVLRHRTKKLNSYGHWVICPTPWAISPIEAQLNSWKTISDGISKFPPLLHKAFK